MKCMIQATALMVMFGCALQSFGAASDQAEADKTAMDEVAAHKAAIDHAWSLAPAGNPTNLGGEKDSSTQLFAASLRELDGVRVGRPQGTGNKKMGNQVSKKPFPPDFTTDFSNDTSASDDERFEDLESQTASKDGAVEAEGRSPYVDTVHQVSKEDGLDGTFDDAGFEEPQSEAFERHVVTQETRWVSDFLVDGQLNAQPLGGADEAVKRAEAHDLFNASFVNTGDSPNSESQSSLDDQRLGQSFAVATAVLSGRAALSTASSDSKHTNTPVRSSRVHSMSAGGLPRVEDELEGFSVAGKTRSFKETFFGTEEFTAGQVERIQMLIGSALAKQVEQINKSNAEQELASARAVETLKKDLETFTQALAQANARINGFTAQQNSVVPAQKKKRRAFVFCSGRSAASPEENQNAIDDTSTATKVSLDDFSRQVVANQGASSSSLHSKTITYKDDTVHV